MKPYLNKFKQILTSYCLTSLFINMASAQTPYSIKGKVVGLPDSTIVYIIKFNDESMLDTIVTSISQGESFHISGNDKFEGKIHFLAFDNSKLKKLSKDSLKPLAFIVEKNDLTIDGSVGTWPDVKFTNSPTNENYYKLIHEIRTINNQIQAKYPQGGAELDSAYALTIKQVFLKYPNDYGTSVIMEKYTPILNETDIKSIYEAFSAKIKEGYYGKRIEKIISYKTDSYQILEGKIIPDFKMLIESGDSISIQKYAASKKYVLLDFWASWCSPCRKEIPNLKEAYAKYGEKGFGIISISIDKSKNAWQEALNKEAMPWLQTRDNLELISGNIFRVSSLPAYVLINKDGQLISFQSAFSVIKAFGPELRDEALDATLSKLFGL